MDHRTIIRNIDGTLTSINCPCGEDHGPSLREELMIMRESNRRAAAELLALVKDMETVLELTKGVVTGVDRIKARKLVHKARAQMDGVATELTVLS